MQVSKLAKQMAKHAVDERHAMVQQQQNDITGIVSTMSHTVTVCTRRSHCLCGLTFPCFLLAPPAAAVSLLACLPVSCTCILSSVCYTEGAAGAHCRAAGQAAAGSPGL